MNEQQAVEEFTRRLRTSQEKGWSSIRELLEEVEVDPESSAVAILYRDDVSLLITVVVATPERMLEIELEYPPELDEENGMREAWIVAWNDDVQRIRNENADFVTTALSFLGY